MIEITGETFFQKIRREEKEKREKAECEAKERRERFAQLTSDGPSELEQRLRQHQR
jgi:putative NIF3 family GTP cyclohydrolase 1 type 2